METVLRRTSCVPYARAADNLHASRARACVLSAFGAAPTPVHAVRGLRGGGLPAKKRPASVIVKAAAASDDESKRFELAKIPAKPRSAVGEMLAFYAKDSPHLLRSAIEDQFAKLEEQQQQLKSSDSSGATDSADSTDLVLYRRMEEVRAAELRLAVEDLMYVSVLEKFMELGVEPLPRVDDMAHVESVANLKLLMEGVHSKDAVELVKEHVLGVLGPASMAYSNTMIKISKLQAAQVYAASLMFGYFLRRVDKRFQLEAALGTLPATQEEAVDRLNRLFAQAASVEESDDPDSVDVPTPSPDYIDEDGRPQYSSSSSASANESRSAGDASTSGAASEPAKKKPNRLRAYVEQFDQQALIETARVLSLEGAAVIEMQTSALFGDIKTLQQQMQGAVGGDARSMDEVMARIQNAVAEGAIETVAMTVGTQRRAVLEAVAFGAFLRDVETHVDQHHHLLLTPAPKQNMGGGGPALLE